jgi:hypothetical protein
MYYLQAFAKHLYNANWEYHHNLSIINRTSFLLNYLTDYVPGASSYAEWINGDLYERSGLSFGICVFPGKQSTRTTFTSLISENVESLRLRLCMQPYSRDTAALFPLNASNDWLRRRQCLALPILPPNSPIARQYFFPQM